MCAAVGGWLHAGGELVWWLVNLPHNGRSFDDNCQVRDGQADAVVVAAKYFGRARAHNLMPIVHEKLDARKSYVAVVAKSVTDPLKDTTPM